MQWHAVPSELVLVPFLKLSIFNAETILLIKKNKGESFMKPLLFVLSQLTLVTLVYAFAYRAGYRSAQSKAMSVVRKFADPVACLFDQLTESMDEAKENAHPTSNIEPSTSNDKDGEL
jgi:hypothetical protein